MLDALAHAADPYPTYAALRDKGVHQHDDGRWVVARADDVAALLAEPAAVVGFTGRGVQASMARFSDGSDHDRRRAWAETRLADIAPEQLRTTAAELTRHRLAWVEEVEEVEVMGTVARHAPIAALAVALGTTDRRTSADKSTLARVAMLCCREAPLWSWCSASLTRTIGLHERPIRGASNRVLKKSL